MLCEQCTYFNQCDDAKKGNYCATTDVRYVFKEAEEDRIEKKGW